LSAKRHLAVALFGACALAGPLAAAVTPPSPAALALAANLRASAMGVDHDGNLWTWDGRAGKVVLYSPAGVALFSLTAGGAVAVDADRAAGVAAISDSGFRLSVLPWNGAGTDIPLPERASAVAWVRPDTVALGMAGGWHRVEIWNLRDRRLVKAFGAELPVTRKPGLARLRTYQMRYDTRRDLLFTLESFSGDLEVFSLDGRLVRREQVPPSDDRASIESWLADLDAKGRAAGEVEDPLITWYRLALDEAGNAWVVRTCEPKGRATLWQVPASGPAKDLTLDEPCCARAFVVWGEHAIFYRYPSDPPLSCNGERRLP
jgi:hypothetical protein